jgi:hypothetical protein
MRYLGKPARGAYVAEQVSQIKIEKMVTQEFIDHKKTC